MALLDKIGAAAKTAGEKANIAIEIGKLNMKIRNESGNVEQFKEQIGDLIWAQFQEGNVTDPQILALCESIVAANDNMEALQAKLDGLKDNGAPSAEAPERHCPQCGAVVLENDRFCNSCGVRL